MSRITKIGSTGSNLKCALNTQTLYQDETERAEGRQRIENRDKEKDRQKQAAGLLTTRTGRHSRKRQGRKRPYRPGVFCFCFFYSEPQQQAATDVERLTTDRQPRCRPWSTRQQRPAEITNLNVQTPKREWNPSHSQETTTELLTEKLQYARLHRPHNERSLLKSRIRFSSYIHKFHFK